MSWKPDFDYSNKNMNFYKVGCNFDPKLIDVAVELNKKYKGKSQIVEFFGSDASNEAVTARPGWRLPDIDKEFFANYVKKLKDNNIAFNYTMNSIQPYGSKIEMLNHKKDIQDLVKWLENIGVYRITVANPMMALFIREVSDINIEVSCIAHIDAVTQIKYWHEVLGADNFCGNLMKNRNKKFLEVAQKYCDENGMIQEVLCNEFCYVAGESNSTAYAAPCTFRDSCYLCHATCSKKEDSLSYNNYPMGYCMSARGKNAQNWLRSRWIRPEDQKIYRSIGVNYFKVTGRTGSTALLERTLEYYMSENFDGNLLELWKPLQTIRDGGDDTKFNHTENIPNKKLDGFLDHWFVGDGFECENELCGTTCKYCENWWKSNKFNELNS